MKKRDPDDERVGLFDRLLAAILAPLFFLIAILVIVSQLANSRYVVGWLLDETRLGRPLGVILIASVIAGFCLGTRGFATFFGHAFYTNTPGERNDLVTVLIWVAIAAFGYYLYTNV